MMMGESLEKGARCEVEWRWRCCARKFMKLIYCEGNKCQALHFEDAANNLRPRHSTTTPKDKAV